MTEASEPTEPWVKIDRRFWEVHREADAKRRADLAKVTQERDEAREGERTLHDLLSSAIEERDTALSRVKELEAQNSEIVGLWEGSNAELEARVKELERCIGAHHDLDVRKGRRELLGPCTVCPAALNPPEEPKP